MLCERFANGFRSFAPLGFVPSGRRYRLVYPAADVDTAKVRTFRAWIARVAALPVPPPTRKRRSAGLE